MTKSQKTAGSIQVGDYARAKATNPYNDSFKGVVEEINFNGIGYSGSIRTDEGLRLFDTDCHILELVTPPSQSNEVSTECKCHCHCECGGYHPKGHMYFTWNNCNHCSPKYAPQDSTNEFMELVILFKGWFADEELEVTDFVLGRMAARLQTYLESRDK